MSETIINGIDVSEPVLTATNNDVYYYQKVVDGLQNNIKRLQEENEELHRHCQICENFIDGIPCKPLRDMDYDLQKVINQRDKYIQALEEIRQLVSDEIDKTDADDELMQIYGTIYNRCNEVLNDNRD